MNKVTGKSRARVRRGFAMIMTLICVVIAVTFGASMIALSNYNLTAADNIRNQTEAFNLAESGCDRAIEWLKNYGYPPTYSVTAFGGTQYLGNGSYTVQIDPDPGNPGALLKRFKITGVGVCRNANETVQEFVREQSFGKYVYFTDQEISSISGDPIWFFSGDRIRGPSHSNNSNGSYFHISWDSSAPQPIFDQLLTASGSQIVWAPSQPNQNQYGDVFGGGVNGYKLGVDPIGLPATTTTQKIEAWGSAGGFPASQGVFTNPAGGIYINGDSTIAMSVVKDGVEQFNIKVGTDSYAVKVDMTSGTTTNTKTTMNGKSTTQTVNGGSTGVIYSNGNITSLSGTLADNQVQGGVIEARSAYTIATDIAAGKTITVPNNIKYKTSVDETVPYTDPRNLKPGTLGLIARNIMVAANAPANLEIDALMMAGDLNDKDGSFYVPTFATKRPTGTLTIIGGIIQKDRGPVGTFNGSGIQTGYAKDYWYDSRLADLPPPYYPTTGGYDELSWRRIGP